MGELGVAPWLMLGLVFDSDAFRAHGMRIAEGGAMLVATETAGTLDVMIVGRGRCVCDVEYHRSIDLDRWFLGAATVSVIRS